MKRLLFNTQYIDHYLQEHKINKKEFAKKCDLSYKFLKEVYNQKLTVDPFKIVGILELLDISADTFFFIQRFRKLKKANK